MKSITFISILMVLIFSCTNPMKKITMPYKNTDFERIIDGKQTNLYTLKNLNGVVVTLTNYGAKLISVYVPDRNGKMTDVLLGFKNLDEYIKNGASHGATVGPYANRIANARFKIDTTVYQLAVNNGVNCLHSGPASFYRKVWYAEEIISEGSHGVRMTIESPDGEFGFPGNKKVEVSFVLTNKNELKISYRAETDKPTHFNLTNHSYFNLRGEGNGDILGHIVVINSKKSTPVADAGMIPTGEIADINGTPLDFSLPHVIGERIEADNQQLKYGSGYDFNYVIDKPADEFGFAASAFEPESGRYMEVFTTEPGVQFYSGNHLKGAETGKSGTPYTKRTGFCFETQHFPDTPNQPGFPSTLVQPGKVFESLTVYKFSVKKQ